MNKILVCYGIKNEFIAREKIVKHLMHIILFISIIACMPTYTIDNCDIILKPKWKTLGCNDNKCADFGGKWVNVGSITFKKRSKEPIFVDEINLSWHGEHLDNLIGSLYRKNAGKNFLAIEKNLVCDGKWNPKTQTLILDFNTEEKLAPTNIFYLVLTVPDAVETILKKGYFSLENNCLPRPFKQCAQNEKLILAINL
jgi:hypothetical protein